MHQRELAREAWRQAGLFETRESDLRAFLDYFEKEVGGCWPDLAEEVRATCPRHKQTLAIPLWQTGDPLIRMNLLNTANLSLRDERRLVERLVGRIDFRISGTELIEAIRLDDPAILDLISRHHDLSPILRDVVSVSRARLRSPRL